MRSEGALPHVRRLLTASNLRERAVQFRLRTRNDHLRDVSRPTRRLHDAAGNISMHELAACGESPVPSGRRHRPHGGASRSSKHTRYSFVLSPCLESARSAERAACSAQCEPAVESLSCCFGGGQANRGMRSMSAATPPPRATPCAGAPPASKKDARQRPLAAGHAGALPQAPASKMGGRASGTARSFLSWPSTSRLGLRRRRVRMSSGNPTGEPRRGPGTSSRTPRACRAVPPAPESSPSRARPASLRRPCDPGSTSRRAYSAT